MRALSTLLFKPGTDVLQPLHQVRRCGLTRRARVGETNLVRKHAVAEEHRQPVASLVGNIIGPVQQVRLVHGLFRVAGEAFNAKALSQLFHAPC